MAEVARETTRLSEPEVHRSPPVILAPGHWEKATNDQRSSELGRKRRDGVARPQAAPQRHVLRHVLATPHGLYRFTSRHELSGGMRLASLLTAHVHREKKGFYGGSTFTQRYFGHWLRDGLPAALLRRSDEALYMPLPDGWPHAAAYLEALEIERVPYNFVYFEELAYSNDFPHTADRQRRIREIHTRLHDRLAPKTPAGGVYFSRGATGRQRVLINEDALIEALKARDFTVLSNTAPLGEIWATMGGADRIVTMEGSHWSHAFFAARRGALHLEINPSDRLNLNHSDYVPALDARLAVVVADRVGDGYRVDIDSVLGILDAWPGAVSESAP